MLSRLVAKYPRTFHRMGFFLTAFLMIVIGFIHIFPETEVVTEIWPGTTAWGVIFIIMGLSSALAGALWKKYDSSPLKNKVRAIAALVMPVALVLRAVTFAATVGWAGLSGVLLLSWMALHILHAQMVLWYFPTEPDEFLNLSLDQSKLRKRLRVVESEVKEALTELEE